MKISLYSSHIKLGISCCVASLVAQLVKNLPAMQETQFDFWIGKTPWRRDRLPIPVFKGLPDGPNDKKKNATAMQET